MRKILFRCKRKDTGEWVYWDMVGRITTPAGRISKVTVEHTYEDEDCYFAHQLWHMLDRPTLGECTGQKDGFKNLIFEGDILVGPRFTDEEGNGVVKWNNGAWEVGNGNRCCSFYENIRSTAYDVIGNIHDNPELLGGETK
jgi:uncharacterized phage protein (TIGR01671 family)